MKRGPFALFAGELIVSFVLILLLGLMFLAAHTVSDPWRGPAVFGLAALEALVVALVLMKLRSAPALFAISAFAGLFFVATLTVLTLTDYPFRQAGERLRTLPDAAPANVPPTVDGAAGQASP